MTGDIWNETKELDRVVDFILDLELERPQGQGGEPMTTVDHPGLQRLVDEALDLGFHCFGDGDHAPFIFLYVGDKGKFIELRSADGTIKESLVETGRKLIREFSESGKYYVLTWDGYLTMAGKRRDAVFAEAGAAGGISGFLFAQQYRQTKSGKLSKLGKPLVADLVDHLWSDTNTEH
jgi:hypothetical protein